MYSIQIRLNGYGMVLVNKTIHGILIMQVYLGVKYLDMVDLINTLILVNIRDLV